MLQIGRFLCRGQGAMLVTGPLGAALVPLDFADSAADVVWGRAGHPGVAALTFRPKRRRPPPWTVRASSPT